MLPSVRKPIYCEQKQKLTSSCLHFLLEPRETRCPRRHFRYKMLIFKCSATILCCVLSNITKAASTVNHPGNTGNHSSIIISAFLCDVIDSKVSTNSVTILDVNEIFMSGSLMLLYELYTRKDFNIFISTQMKN